MMTGSILTTSVTKEATTAAAAATTVATTTAAAAGTMTLLGVKPWFHVLLLHAIILGSARDYRCQ